MKANKLFMLALAAGAMVLGACSSEDGLLSNNDLQEQNTGKDYFTAGLETGVTSKTYLDGTTDNKVLWETDDAVKIFNDKTSGNYEGKYVVYSGAGETSCTFVNADGVTAVDAATTNYYALYPYQADAHVSSGVITGIDFPSEQTAVAGAYDPSAAIMVATSTTKNFQFKNVNSLIKVTPTCDCTEIIITAKGTNEYLAGKVNVTPGTTPTSEVTEGSTSVTLSGIIQADSTYYIAVLPGTVSGFTVTFVKVESDNSGNLGLEKSKQASYTFARSKMVNFGSLGTANMTACTAPDQPAVTCGVVDMGESMSPRYWAKYNVGASSTNPYGSYFQWGDVESLLASYTLTSLSEMTDSAYITYKNIDYNNRGGYNSANYSSVNEGSKIDNSTVTWSTTTNDAAYKIMGSPWRMPTSDEFLALRNNCVWVYCSDVPYGGQSCNGYKVYRAKSTDDAGICCYSSKVVDKGGADINRTVKSVTDAYENNAFLFLPCAGIFDGTSFNTGGRFGRYWSSSFNNNTNASYLFFGENTIYPKHNFPRYLGFTVRGVCQ